MLHDRTLTSSIVTDYVGEENCLVIRDCRYVWQAYRIGYPDGPFGWGTTPAMAADDLEMIEAQEADQAEPYNPYEDPFWEGPNRRLP